MLRLWQDSLNNFQQKDREQLDLHHVNASTLVRAFHSFLRLSHRVLSTARVGRVRSTFHLGLLRRPPLAEVSTGYL